MNAFDEEPVAIVAEPAINVGTPVPSITVMEQEVPEVPVPVPEDADTAVTEPVGAEESPGVEPVPEISGQEQEQEEQPQVIEEEKEDPDMLELVAQDPAEVEAEDDEEVEVLPPRRSTWIAGGILIPSCYAMASTKVKRTEG